MCNESPQGADAQGICVSEFGRAHVVLLVDTAGRIISANNIAVDHLGANVDQLSGTSLFEASLGASNEAPGIPEWFLEVIESGQPLCRKTEHAGRIFETHYHPLKGEGSNVNRLAVYSTDITERVAFAKQAHRDEARCRVVFDESAIGIAIVGFDHFPTETNPSFQQMFGYTGKELSGLRFTDLSPPNDIAAYVALVEELNAGKRDSFEIEKRYIHKDGHIVCGHLTMSLVRDSSGVPQFCIAMVQDISERKNLEEKLRSRFTLEKIFSKHMSRFLRMPLDETDACITDALGDMVRFAGGVCGSVYFFDPELKSISCTHEWVDDPGQSQIAALEGLRLERFAYYRSLIRNRQPIKIARPADIPAHATEELERIKSHGFHPMVVVPRFLGERLHGMVAVRGALDTEIDWSEDFVTTLGLMANIITEVLYRRESEREKQALAEQLRRAQAMDALGKFASGVAHDFNNMLTVVLSYSKIAANRPDITPQLDLYFREINKAGHRAKVLTSQLLALGRRELLQPETIDLNEIIAEMNHMLDRVTGEQIDLVTSSTLDTAHILADRVLIERMIVNLVFNARDSMGAEGTLTISVDEAPASRSPILARMPINPLGYLMLSVKDTGIGMDDAVLANIFDPFFTTKEINQGAGLGLASVYASVKQSKGEITVESTLGRGSTFRVFLPRVAGKDRAHQSHDPPPSTSPRSSATILFVEDEAIVRLVGCQILEESGCIVLAAATAQEALDLCNEHDGKIDLLLTDLVLPGIGGVELAERVRQHRPETRVAFVSGHSEDIVAAAKGRTFERTPILAKPYEPTNLISLVIEAMGWSE